MRFRTHLIVSALAGVALYRRAPRRAALLTVAGVAIDFDHMLLYALRSGDWSPAGALRYDRLRGQPIRPGDTRPRYGSLRSIVHRPALTLPLLWLLAWRFPALRPVALGLSLHLALDASPLHADWRVWSRARGHCERCGVAGLEMGIYYLTLPARGGSRWDASNRVAWCRTCAREARRA